MPFVPGILCQALPRPMWYMVARLFAAAPLPASAARQRPTLVHFSAQPKPFWSVSRFGPVYDEL